MGNVRYELPEAGRSLHVVNLEVGWPWYGAISQPRMAVVTLCFISMFGITVLTSPKVPKGIL